MRDHPELPTGRGIVYRLSDRRCGSEPHTPKMADGRSVDLPRFHAPLDFESRWDTGPGTILVVQVVPMVSQRPYIEYSKNTQQPQNRSDNHDADQNLFNSVIHWDVSGGQP